MKIKKRNIIKNTKARVLPYSVLFMLVFTAFSTVLFISTEQVKADGYGTIVGGVVDSEEWETISSSDYTVDGRDVIVDADALYG